MKSYSPIIKNFFSILDNYITGYSIKASSPIYNLTNVSPGPAPINMDVIKKVANDLDCSSNTKINKFNFGNTPLEMSHRCPEFKEIFENVNNKIRKLMEIDENFELIWTQGGGHGQFSAIPLNLKEIFPNLKGNYFVTGTWSERAFLESKKFIDSENITSGFFKDKKFSLEYNFLPESIQLSPNVDYLYVCSNETINGLEFREDGYCYPDRKSLGKTKLIVDMSSDFLMKRVDWEKIDIAFACTSKNMGVAGANLVVIRRNILDSLDKIKEKKIPCVLDWDLYFKNDSLYNTPAVFNFYLLDKILDNYIQDFKTIDNIEKNSKQKAKLLYDYFEKSKIYKPVVSDIKVRSNINIPFLVNNGNKKTCVQFLQHCFHHNLVGIRTQTPFSYSENNLVEPLRISLYNGIDLEDVERIIKVMDAFEIKIE